MTEKHVQQDLHQKEEELYQGLRVLEQELEDVKRKRQYFIENLHQDLYREQQDLHREHELQQHRHATCGEHNQIQDAFVDAGSSIVYSCCFHDLRSLVQT
ncbi:hypothetical protein BG004_001473 [Podila humilis]|nr:hypothetical protein BG004_001473 [Podila humilis]